MIWLDHAATSLPRDEAALAAAIAAADLPTPGRGHHAGQRAATELLERARATAASLVGLPVACFTSGATFSLNAAIAGWRPRPRRIAVDPWAHNAVARAITHNGAAMWTLPTQGGERIDLDEVTRQWPADVDLVVLTHASNVTGHLLPLAELIAIARGRGAAVIVDAAQTAGLVPAQLFCDADAVAFSAHKALRALPGVGVLALREGVTIDPIVVGGSGSDADEPIAEAVLPGRLEVGTPNLPGIAAMAAAAAQPVRGHYSERAATLREAILRADLSPLGGNDLPIACVKTPVPYELEDLLDRGYGIRARAGMHCAPMAHRTLGTHPIGTLRLSAGASTTPADLEVLTRALRESVTFLDRGGSRP